MIFGEEHQPQQPQPQRVQLNAANMDTVYANSFAMATTPDEISLYLGVNTPLPNAKQPMIMITHRVVMFPQNAKRLMLALQQTIKAYEDRFGPIELPPGTFPKQ